MLQNPLLLQRRALLRRWSAVTPMAAAVPQASTIVAIRSPSMLHTCGVSVARRHCATTTSSSSKPPTTTGGGDSERATDAARRSSEAASSATEEGAPRVTRDTALARWGGKATTAERAKDTINRLRPFSSSPSEVFGDVLWEPHERMDFALDWMLPAPWETHTRTKANCLSIQCVPPRPARPGISRDASSGDGGADGKDAAPPPPPDPQLSPSVHGLSLTAFAYHRAVQDADADALMSTFLRSFSKSVANSLIILGSSDTRQPALLNDESVARCTVLAETCGGNVTEIKFTPPQCPTIPARGLARAFFGTTLREHYIAVFAVPEDEFMAVEDLVTFGVTNVRQTAQDTTR